MANRVRVIRTGIDSNQEEKIMSSWEKIKANVWYNVAEDRLLTLSTVRPTGYHRVEYRDMSGNLCKMVFNNKADASAYIKEYTATNI